MNDPKKIELMTDLERKILKGISMEWDMAVAFLNEPHKSLIKKPRFTLMNSRRELGRWSREPREIALNRELILNHPWDAVVDVLLHEMAHQFADELLSAHGESAHGPSFLKACKLLKAKPQASGSYQTLHERVKGGSTSEPDKMMAKIRKLLSLAESQNRHEAENAMAKAHELIQKYNIDVARSGEKKNFESIFIGKPTLKRFREEHYLATLICDFYFVAGVWTIAYVLGKEAMGRVFEISGTHTNLIIAEYVYHFIVRYMESEWQRYNAGKKLNRSRKTDFCVGLIKGFEEKLKKKHPSPKNHSVSESRTIMTLKEPALMAYFKERHPRIRHSSMSAILVDPDVMFDGHAVGRKMVLSHGITEQQGNQGLLIGHGK